jgi:hypothetical protein
VQSDKREDKKGKLRKDRPVAGGNRKSELDCLWCGGVRESRPRTNNVGRAGMTSQPAT